MDQPVSPRILNTVYAFLILVKEKQNAGLDRVQELFPKLRLQFPHSHRLDQNLGRIARHLGRYNILVYIKDRETIYLDKKSAKRLGGKRPPKENICLQIYAQRELDKIAERSDTEKELIQQEAQVFWQKFEEYVELYELAKGKEEEYESEAVPEIPEEPASTSSKRKRNWSGETGQTGGDKGKKRKRVSAEAEPPLESSSTDGPYVSLQSHSKVDLSTVPLTKDFNQMQKKMLMKTCEGYCLHDSVLPLIGPFIFDWQPAETFEQLSKQYKVHLRLLKDNDSKEIDHYEKGFKLIFEDKKDKDQCLRRFTRYVEMLRDSSKENIGEQLLRWMQDRDIVSEQ